MYRRYYQKFDEDDNPGQNSVNYPASLNQDNTQRTEEAAQPEIIIPHKPEELHEEPEPEVISTIAGRSGNPFMRNGKIFGLLDLDDVIILLLILLFLSDSTEDDIFILIVLGFLFFAGLER